MIAKFPSNNTPSSETAANDNIHFVENPSIQKPLYSNNNIPKAKKNNPAKMLFAGGNNERHMFRELNLRITTPYILENTLTKKKGKVIPTRTILEKRFASFPRTQAENIDAVKYQLTP
ncbi:hypothetical protein EQT97_06085 [Fructilactobacillus sanfranciscensis]|uniref:hypothetical protein n=1 Tax=Fructilactobacillus sanfranciscensis TaxID=1625 RepID=UPI001EF06D6D|nr:hypothetical protein [Fructilactobacillus sanfranciscensis]MCG7195083.1 hypothetical protein [Fructilactobacillus sanfranciscensis]